MNKGMIISAMIDYLDGDIHETEHFLKVYGYAKAIGEAEGLDSRTMEILEIAAIVHDIGIPRAKVVYNSDAGKYQEELGPAEADELLTALNCPADIKERVCYLVGHHHTYTGVDGIDYTILLEADFLVNATSHNLGKSAIMTAKSKFFHTETGKHYLKMIFGV